MNQAPPDSSDNEYEEENAGNRKKPGPGEVSNKPFTCCLGQYGIEVPESDPQKCDAGEGKRYERMFGLFGTTIC
jgi:protection of telomeres protein 1